MEERTPYIIDTPAHPAIADEFRRARADFARQVNQATEAERRIAELERRLKDQQNSASYLAGELAKVDKERLQLWEAAQEVCYCSDARTGQNFTEALRCLARLVNYPESDL